MILEEGVAFQPCIAGSGSPDRHVAGSRSIGLGFGRSGVGESVMTNGHVFAGVVRWPGGGNLNAPPDTLGGVFRLGLGETRWEHMTAGLPEICHVPCLTVDPHDFRRLM